VLEPPQASLQGPSQGFVGEPVQFDASASQSGSSPIVSYSWSFGNGEGLPASPDPGASAIYTRTGAYEVSVTVMDANGLSSLATTQINIDARLDTDVWTLSAINQEPLLPGTAITLQFLGGELAGFAGCNTYQGSYTVTDNGDGTYSVVTGEISTSRLACPLDIMQQENDYLTALKQTAIASIQENMLVLTNPAGELIFYLINPP
jgi:heat shock protein HslJ